MINKDNYLKYVSGNCWMEYRLYNVVDELTGETDTIDCWRRGTGNPILGAGRSPALPYFTDNYLYKYINSSNGIFPSKGYQKEKYRFDETRNAIILVDSITGNDSTLAYELVKLQGDTLFAYVNEGVCFSCNPIRRRVRALGLYIRLSEEKLRQTRQEYCEDLAPYIIKQQEVKRKNKEFVEQHRDEYKQLQNRK